MEEELNEHIKRTHHCVKPGCPFSHMNAEISYNHTLSHWLNNVDYMCGVCNKVFDDQAQLNNHMAQTHNLSCIVCHSSHFTNRQALMDHSKYCNMADLDEKSGPWFNADSSTMSLLLKALSEAKADIPAHRL